MRAVALLESAQREKEEVTNDEEEWVTDNMVTPYRLLRDDASFILRHSLFRTFNFPYLRVNCYTQTDAVIAVQNYIQCKVWKKLIVSSQCELCEGHKT